MTAGILLSARTPRNERGKTRLPLRRLARKFEGPSAAPLLKMCTHSVHSWPQTTVACPSTQLQVQNISKACVKRAATRLPDRVGWLPSSGDTLPQKQHAARSCVTSLAPVTGTPTTRATTAAKPTLRHSNCFKLPLPRAPGAHIFSAALEQSEALMGTRSTWQGSQ